MAHVAQILAITVTALLSMLQLTTCSCTYSSSNCAIKLYDEPDQGGRVLVVREQNADLVNDDFDNAVKSITVFGPCKWLLYRFPDFQGTVDIYEEGGHNVAPTAGSQATLSSLRALPPGGTIAIALFDDVHYKGRMEIVCEETNAQSLQDQDFDDSAKSAISIEGKWGLYADIDFTGDSDTLDAGVQRPDLGSLQVRVSSVKLL